jgi:glutamate dehydrogenase
MQAILKAPVDLLWFGGIGTYIRASEETDAQAGDKANDAIRITGAMLNAKVVGEGANLGCTQRGRIEAAKRGVRINTDAIDNSAGVNTSDVEVNLKIALSIPMKDQRLNEESRNALLAGLTDEVGQLVLRNNYLQSLALSLAQRQGAAGLAQAQRLMQGLEQRGRLDRAVEFLPGDAEIARRLAAGEGATRPELAVLLAYAKLSFFDDLIASPLPDDPYFADELDRYFPAAIRERFPDAVSGHRLRREIVATQLSNIVINRCGPAAIARFADETGADASAVAAAYALTRDAFGLLDLNGAIDALDARIHGAVQLDLYAAVQAMLTGRMSWFLRNVDLGAALGPQVQRFRAGVEAARGSTLDLITPAQAEAGRQRIAEWTGRDVPEDLAMRIVGLTALAAAPDAVLVAEQTGVSVAEALKTLFALAERLQVGRIKRAGAEIHVADRFERLAADRAVDGLDLALRRLGAEVAGRYGTGAAGVEAFATARAKDVARITGAIEDILASGLSQPKLTIAANLIGDLARGYQWRKWRTPVKTIARPASSAAAITSLSRIEPPGWITAVAPAAAAASRPSAKGKKASEATTEPLASVSAGPRRLAASSDFQAAMREESTRLIWPAPTPTVAPSFGIDDGVRLDMLGDAEGELQIAQFLCGRGAFGHHLQVHVVDHGVVAS